MKVTIDNLSGAGPTDYTGSIKASKSVTITRRLNAPSECGFFFLPDAQGLALPVRYSLITLSDSNGLILFTGYVASMPSLILVGGGMMGACYEAQITAISDELLLDSVLSVNTGTAFSQPVGQSLQMLAQLAGAPTLTMSPASSTAIVGRYEAQAATKWSEAAGLLASSARSAYRVVAGVTSITAVGTVTHALNEADGSLQLGSLKAATVKLLANDVTVCGKIEPGAYVSETFQGDGATREWQLTNLPFEPSAVARLKFADLFQGASLNAQMWQWTDSGSRLSITANGVTCAGGSGRDGETVLSAIHQLELGGSIVLEAGGVEIGAACQGLLLGLYEGSVALSNCLAAFQVSQSAGVPVVSALINGVMSGGSIQPITGHTYTLRMRVYCPEMERVHPSYYYFDSNGANSYGGGVVIAPGHLALEVQDVTSGLPGLAVVLYDGTFTVLPPACTIGLFDSGNLVCSIKTFSCSQGSPLWVTLTLPGGTAASQYLDTAVRNGSCKVASGGILTFYAGTVPASGALICISYRTKHRAVARRSIPQGANATGATSTVPATTMWVGTISKPAALSSVDCDNAATALLKSSAVASAAWAGTYTTWNVEGSGVDVWPGDVLAITSASAGIDALVVVRDVQIDCGHAFPQMIQYTIRFANDWAEELALKLSDEIPEDVWLPAVPSTGSQLSNLVGMKMTVVTGTQIQVDAGVAPPGGGGFEVKRKDWSFGPGQDSDLVLRTPVQHFIIPRLAAMEQYYVRMYDGSTPPNYSGLSSAIFINVPLGGS